MALTPEIHKELHELLEALCEERLTDAQTLRLEEIVLGHRSARKIYLDYIHLHGTLIWDAAQADDYANPAVTAGAMMTGAGKERTTAAAGGMAPSDGRFRRFVARRSLWGSGLALAVMVLVGLAYWNGGPGTQETPEVAQADLVAPHGEKSPTVVAGPRPDTYRPIDRPHLRPTAPEPKRPVTAAAPPEVIEVPADIVGFVNTQLAATWADAEVTPSDPADDAEWLRRVYLDLVGHIPSREEAARFLAESGEDKKARVVERLLGSSDFSRHFATIWTNLLIGRSESLAAPGDRGALFADMEKSFAENRPWDDLAMSLVEAEGPIDQNPAANFLVAHLNNQAVPATAITARVLLGTQVQCMQCHNHPFNSWRQRDFWELNAFFKQTELTRDERKVPTLVSRPVGGATTFETRQGLVHAAYPIFEGKTVSQDSDINRRRQLAELMAEGEKTQLAEAFVNRVWAQLFGAGFTTPIDDMGPHNSPTHPIVLDRLSRAFVRSGYDVRELVRWITATEAYQLSSRMNKTNTMDDPSIGELPLFSRVYPKDMSVEQAYDSLLVATNVEPPLGNLRRRNEWVAQFVETYETDENDESVRFSGSIPAALALMNGEVTETGIAGKEGSTLADVLNGPGDQSARLNELALAALGRPLTSEELSGFSRIIHRQLQSLPPAKRPEAAQLLYQDVFWALLNSGEFLTVP